MTIEVPAPILVTAIDSIKAKGLQIAALYADFDPANTLQSEQIALLQRELATLRESEVAKAQLSAITSALSFVIPRGDMRQKVKEQMLANKVSAFTIHISLADNAEAMPDVSLTLGKASKASTNGTGGTKVNARQVTIKDRATEDVVWVGVAKQGMIERGQGGVVTAAKNGLANRQTHAQFTRQQEALGYIVVYEPDFDDPAGSA